MSKRGAGKSVGERKKRAALRGDLGPAARWRHDERQVEAVVGETGATIRRARNLTLRPIDRMRRNGTITERQWLAGDRFNAAFEGALMGGRYARVDFDRPIGNGTGAGGDLPEGAMARRESVRRVLGRIGGISLSCLWSVVGEGMSLKDWCLRLAAQGLTFNESVAKGVLIVTLDLVADHYRLPQGEIKFQNKHLDSN